MKINRLQWEYRTNASKLHRAVGDALRHPTSPFQSFKIYQEYPVDKVNPLYHNAAHKFDWVVLDLYLVIEAHGRQHYEPVSFGKGGDDEVDLFHSQVARDKSKMDAAVDAGFTYVVVSYNEFKDITPTLLWNKYKDSYNDSPLIELEKGPKSDYQKKMEAEAKERRHGQYLWMKELKAQRAKEDK